MNWFEIIALLGTMFIFSIIGVMFFKKCSTKDATIICRDFVKDILRTIFAPTPPPKQYYPTIAGWDGNRIIPQLVDADFRTISEIFTSCFCTNFAYTPTGDLIMYQFDILRKPNSYDDSVLEQIIQKQSEEVVTNIMRVYDFSLPAEPLTLIELFPTKLCVAFARTEDGIKMLDEKKRKMQKRKVMNNRTTHNSMSETWRE